MANFLQNIFDRLQHSADRVVLREIHGERFIPVTGGELLVLVERARGWLRSSGAEAGDRCGLIGANSIHWVAMDMALMAEGIVVVPLYHRQTPSNLPAC
jgi:long-chain acyl-CoA synthetase